MSLTSTRRALSRGALATLLWLALSAGTLSAAEPAWTRLDTPSFTFFSNASAEVTRRFAGDLETFRRFVAASLGDGAVASPLPTHVYLFDSHTSFRDFSLGERNVGWFAGTRQANVIALDTSSAAGAEVAYHEYVHFVVENSTPAVPLWLNEGLAEFYSTFRSRAEELEIGRPLERHVEFLRRNRLISFDDLFAVDRRSSDYTEERRRGAFYAQSWAFVHYLLVGQKEFHVEVDDFLSRLRDGQTARDAFEDAFGTTTVGLRRDLEHYLSQASFEYLVMAAEPDLDESPGQPVVLADAEARARLGLLRLAGKVGTEADSERDFNAALGGEPANPTALRGMGELDLGRGDYLQAAAWFAEALRHEPGDVANLDLHGLALLQVVQADAAPPGGLDPARRDILERARTSFAQAISRAPTYAPALAGYGTTFFWDDDPGEGIEVSARAVRLLPRNAVILASHLALVAQAGELERARRVYDWLHRPAVRPTPAHLAAAERALFNAEFRHLTLTYRRPEQYPDLLVGLESLHGRAPDGQLQAQLDDQIERLRETIERNYWADAFNGALNLLQVGEWSVALELLARIAIESNDPDITRQAERILGDAAAGAGGGG
jgi:tetratricopeptide (TPR) repeat protein